MKRYEKIAYLKKQIRLIQLKYDKYESRLPKMERNLENLRAYHKKIEEVSIREIENYRDTKAQIYDVLQQRIQALRNFDSKSKPKPKPKVVNGNGKVLCDICKKEFSKQGYPAHRKKCERIKALELEIAKELNEEVEEVIEVLEGEE